MRTVLAGRLNERHRMILSGMVSLALLTALTVFGVKVAFGALDGGYEVNGLFTAAGQGLIDGADVKVRGVDVGEVSGIELVDGKALVTMRIEDGERVPKSTRAVIRPKTLFGEKYVDFEVADGAIHGPYLRDGDRIEKTLGGFELERVLSEAYPILDHIDPKELSVVLGTLADAGDQLGPVINRQIVNTAKVLDINARHDADTRQFLHDFALLSDELAARADDLVATAKDLNVALPPLNQRSDELATLLDQTSRLSSDVADVLDSNRSFLRKNVTEGGKTLDLLAGRRERIAPLVTGIRQYMQTLAQVIRLPLGDGTLAAAVKGITGGDLALALQGEGEHGPPAPPSGQQAPTGPAPPPLPSPTTTTLLPPPTVTTPTVPAPETGGSDEGDVGDLLRGLFR